MLRDIVSGKCALRTQLTAEVVPSSANVLNSVVTIKAAVDIDAHIAD